MLLNADYIGKRFTQTQPYVVSRDQIRSFAAAIGADAAVHHDVAAARALGYPDLLAPPTFFIVVARATFQQLVDEAPLGFDPTRSVHGRQHVSFHRPIVAGDVLVCEMTVLDVVTGPSHGRLVTRTEIRTADGGPVQAATAELVIRGG